MRSLFTLFGGASCLLLALCFRVTQESKTSRSPQSTDKSATTTDRRQIHSAELDDLCHFEIPDRTQERAKILKFVGVQTNEVISHSQQYGSNGGGFGGGQFGGGLFRSPRIVPPPQSKSEIGTNAWEFTLTSNPDRHTYLWSNRLHAIVHDGLVYHANPRHVTSMPDGEVSSRFFQQIVSADLQGHLDSNENAWRISKVQVVDLKSKAAYGSCVQHASLELDCVPVQIAELGNFELASIANMRAGAKRIVTWNHHNNCLQVVGAIRANGTCFRCHELKTGDLVAAFTYRLEAGSTSMRDAANDAKRDKVNEAFVRDLPSKARDLDAVLRCLHNNTVQTFEASPMFGVGREPEPLENHPVVPTGDTDAERWDLRVQLRAKLSGRQTQWMWLNQIRGMTHRGYVYQVNDRNFVEFPPLVMSLKYLKDLVSSEGSSEVAADEGMWRLDELQLVGLLMHDHPIVYDRQFRGTQSGSRSITRDLDLVEAELLEELSNGADLSFSWDEGHSSLLMLGAIRAKANCLKCHDVNQNDLLGAFAYRITEVR